MMNVKPIIFSVPMVRALIEGRKTRTRRMIKAEVPPKPSDDNIRREAPLHETSYLDAYCGEKKTDQNPRGASDSWCWWTRDDRPGLTFKVSYAPGDLLWVRETWAPLDALTHNDPGVQALADRGFYRADDSTVDGEVSRWCPSIHMPRWASRLTLEVTDVKVERLQDIEGQHPTESDAISEGVRAIHHGDGEYYYHAERDEPHPGNWIDPADAFHELWDKLNAERGFGWGVNPWVAAVTFTVHNQNIDALLQARMA